MMNVREILKQSIDKPIVAVGAKRQTAGRGTHGRKWVGYEGNIFLTVSVPVPSLPLPLTLVPLRIGTIIASEIASRLHPENVTSLSSTSSSAAAAPTSTTGDLAPSSSKADGGVYADILDTTKREGSEHRVTVKWPNDVLIGQRKVCGMLIEMENDRLLIGIGVNVRQAPDVPSDGPDRGRPATCMAMHGAESDDSAVQSLSRAIALRIGRWAMSASSSTSSSSSSSSSDSPAQLQRDWSALVDWQAPLVLRDTQERVQVLGLNEDGTLQVRGQAGDEKTLVAEYLW